MQMCDSYRPQKTRKFRVSVTAEDCFIDEIMDADDESEIYAAIQWETSHTEKTADIHIEEVK